MEELGGQLAAVTRSNYVSLPIQLAFKELQRGFCRTRRVSWDARL